MKTVPLGEVAKIERQGVDPTTVDPATRYIGLEHIERGGRIVGHESVAEAKLSSTKFQFTPEHVLFGKLRPNLGKITRPSFGGVCSTDILPIRPGKSLDRDYLFHYLSQPAMVAFAASRTSGANLPRLNPTVLSTFEIPLPPLAEQRRISAILDHADALRAKRRQVITHLDQLAQAIFHDMFDDFSGEFMTVEDVAAPRKGSIRTGPFGSQLLHSEFVDAGIAVLGLDNVVGNRFSWGERRYITPEKYSQLHRYTVHPGDVLVSIMGTCGRCVVVPTGIETAINTKHICAITLDPGRALPEFVRAAFLWHPESHRHLMQQTKGSIMDGLNMGIVKAMPLPAPPVESQKEFVSRLAAVDALSGSGRRSAHELDDVFISLQTRAFSGAL